MANFESVLEALLAILSFPDSNKKKTNAGNVSLVLILLASVFWLIIELQFIFNHLVSPVAFIILFALTGIAVGIFTILALHRLDIIKEMQQSNFIVCIVIACITSIAAASFVNREYAATLSTAEVCTLLEEPICEHNGRSVRISIKKSNFLLYLPATIGAPLQKNSSFTVWRAKGLLGFQFITDPVVTE